MKIAVVSDDGETISKHFGRASGYLVFTVDGGEIVDKEWREKPGHRQPAHEPHNHYMAGSGEGFGTHSKARHAQMMEVIRDCDAIIVADVICGTYVQMKEINIRPFVTRIEDVEQAVEDFIAGRLDDYAEWLH